MFLFYDDMMILGSGLVDEDVDIGGNELPVSSYPPAERKKDTGHQSSTYVTSGSSSGNNSGLLTYYMFGCSCLMSENCF